jgi:bifunctional DNA-binding transcriptional regulator/antitoxin component of YhaV-PrlF toxin-antitoxin module
MQSKVSVRGQTVIPREIRKALGITTDTVLQWSVKNGVLLVYPVPKDPVAASIGILRGRGPSTQELLEERRREREREAAQEQEV